MGTENTSEWTLGGLILSTIVVIFLTSVGSMLVSAFMVGVAVVCADAAFRTPEGGCLGGGGGLKLQIWSCRSDFGGGGEGGCLGGGGGMILCCSRCRSCEVEGWWVWWLPWIIVPI